VSAAMLARLALALAGAAGGAVWLLRSSRAPLTGRNGEDPGDDTLSPGSAPLLDHDREDRGEAPESPASAPLTPQSWGKQARVAAAGSASGSFATEPGAGAVPRSSRRGAAARAEGAAANLLADRLCTLVLAWCAVWALVWLGLALMRMRYPYELEWIGGAMRDHGERVLAGRPLYLAPGPDWFPYEYPPLYFWASAALMRLLHDTSYLSMRLISIASTIGCAAILGLWVRQASPGRPGGTWGAIAAGMFLATYRFTGAWYDVERLDMLFLFLSMLGGYWLALACPTGGGAGGRRGTAQARTAAGAPPGTYKTDETHKPDRPDNTEPASRGRALGLVLLSAVAFWLAFLTKQQAILFIVGGVGALAWLRQWRALALFGGASAALCLASVALLNRATDGWFGYYCFHVPLANGIRPQLAAQFLFEDLPLFAPAIVACAGALLMFRHAGIRESGYSGIRVFGARYSVFGVRVAGSRREAAEREAVAPQEAEPPLRQTPSASRPQHPNTRTPEHPNTKHPNTKHPNTKHPNTEHRTPNALLPTLSWSVTGLAGSLLSRAHWGGDQNVLMSGYSGLTLLACAFAARLERKRPTLAAPLYALALAQLLPLAYRPDAQLPGPAQRAAAERYLAEVRSLEREGEVLCLDHGGMTTPSHFQIMALLDVIGSEKRMPPSLLAALRSHRFAAILVDSVPSADGALGPILTYYRPAECLHMTTTWTVTGFPTPSPGREVWVLRPR